MSGTGEVRTEFAGEERLFRIRLGELRRIEAKCDSPIGDVARRLARCVLVSSRLPMLEALATGVEVRADDAREVLYQGLVAAGEMKPADVTKLLVAEIDDRGLPGVLAAATVALDVLTGSQEQPPGEPQAGESPASGEAQTPD